MQSTNQPCPYTYDSQAYDPVRMSFELSARYVDTNVKKDRCLAEARAFAQAFFVVSILMTVLLEGLNALPSIWGLTIIILAGYCAAHYQAKRAHGRNISRMGAAHPR